MNLPSVKDILDTTRTSYLNDASGGIYTDAKLLPLFKTVYGFLETSLEQHGIRCKNGEFNTIVRTGEVLLTQPADFMWPLFLTERLKGSPDNFMPMVERRFIPTVPQTDKLIYWAWNLENIQLLGATTDREVNLTYLKRFPTIQDVDNYVYGKADQYLSAALGAIAHLFLSQSETLAKACQDIAEKNLNEILATFIKGEQAMPVRRKPYVPFR